MLWLTFMALIPMVGATLMIVLRGRAAQICGLAFATAALIVAFFLACSFEAGGGFQFTEKMNWIPAFSAYYSLGMDGIGLSMVLMTTILTPLVLLAAWSDKFPSDRMGAHVFTGLILAVESLSLFVFLSTDVLLFYFFFEATLIPMYFIIGGFGGKRRQYAAIKFLLFSLAGGLVLLASVIGLYVVSSQAGSPSYLLTDLQTLIAGHGISEWAERWIFIGFIVAFVFKTPMVPAHTWLPDAAENATPSGATMLVSVLDKIGTFGMIRFGLFLFPGASEWASEFMMILAVISIVYGGFAALGQENLMRLISFTSISHCGFIVLGIFAASSASIGGSAFYMFNHGISTAALFLAVGFLIRRRGSALVSSFGGVQTVAPVMAGFLLLAGLSSLAIPGMSTFVSEFMVIAGTWGDHPILTVIAVTGVLLSALYIMVTLRRIVSGPTPDPVRETVSDLTQRERWTLTPLVLILLILGFFPKPMLDVLQPEADELAASQRTAVVKTLEADGAK